MKFLPIILISILSGGVCGQTLLVPADSVIKKYKIKTIFVYTFDSTQKDLNKQIKNRHILEYDVRGNLLSSEQLKGSRGYISKHVYTDGKLKRTVSTAVLQTDTTEYVYDDQNRFLTEETKTYYDNDGGGLQLILRRISHYKYLHDTLVTEVETYDHLDKSWSGNSKITFDTVIYRPNKSVLLSSNSLTGTRRHYKYDRENRLVAIITERRNGDRAFGGKDVFTYIGKRSIREEAHMLDRENTDSIVEVFEYYLNEHGLPEMVKRLNYDFPMNKLLLRYEYY
jgi:hypothetical protein